MEKGLGFPPRRDWPRCTEEDLSGRKDPLIKLIRQDCFVGTATKSCSADLANGLYTIYILSIATWQPLGNWHLHHASRWL